MRYVDVNDVITEDDEIICDNCGQEMQNPRDEYGLEIYDEWYCICGNRFMLTPPEE